MAFRLFGKKKKKIKPKRKKSIKKIKKKKPEMKKKIKRIKPKKIRKRPKIKIRKVKKKIRKVKKPIKKVKISKKPKIKPLINKMPDEKAYELLKRYRVKIPPYVFCKNEEELIKSVKKRILFSIVFDIRMVWNKKNLIDFVQHVLI